MKKNRRRNKAILSLLLASILAVEPAGAATTVRAEENTGITVSAEADPGEEQDNGIGDVPVTSDGQESQNTGNASETEEDQEGQTENAENTDRTENEGSDSSNAGAGTGTDSENEGEDGGKADADNTGENEGAGSGEGEESEGTGSDDSGETDGEEDVENLDGTAEEEDAEDAEATETEEDTEDSETDADKLTAGFTPMSSGYRLTAEQMESKRDLAAHLDEISGYEEGVDYVEGQVITFAETLEEAELIADAYHAQIAEFEYGVLTLELSGEDTGVTKAMQAAADVEINLPAVWPNYYRYAYGEVATDETAFVDDAPENMPEQDDTIEIDIEEYEAEEDGETEGTEGIEQAGDSYLDALAYSDPYLKSTSGCYQYHHTIIGSPYAWATGYTGQGIKVAVLDTGVANHTDVSATSIFGSGTSDSNGHGTHVAGIIGAKANGKLGAGVAPNVTLYSGNVLPDGTGTDDDIIRAIKAAQTKKVDIINMSLGGLGYNGAFQQAVDDAYKQGIAIFSASGNDGGNNYTYPSCYNHVISVAATDANNERAYFSNYGNKVDLSAPGVSIWSTSRDGSNYTCMSGTSMACPVAAGEAAVILSGNASVRSKTGKARVDALESLMKANTYKIGSGMGSGITSLPKALKLSTAVTKPATPTIQFTPDNTKTAQTVKVAIQAKGEVTIYYTTNGKTPTYKNGLVGNGAVQYTKQFEIKNQAKATVKAIAVNENGVASSVRSASYTLKPYVSSITISGVQQIAKGKSVQMKAEVLPAYATNKKVTWELYTADNKKIDAKLAKEVGVSITSAGKVAATKNAKTGSYTIRVTAKDNGAKSATYKITVIDTVKIDTVKFMDKVKNVALKNVTLTLPTNPSHDLGKSLEGKCKDGATAAVSDFKWSSSNATVAKVDAKGVVTPLKAGKVTITALANDSSGKKATCTITIKQLATGIAISGNAKVAAGKSLTFKATVTPSYTTNKKVTWKLKDASGQEVTTQRGKEIGVSINPSSGKLTTTSKAAAGTYTVTASAADGSRKSDSKSVVVNKGIITGIKFENTAYKNVSIFRKQQVSGTKISTTVYATMQGTDGADLTAYEVLNSNPGIASVTQKRSGDRITLTITATGKAAGKTNITIAATDGSNKKLTCAVTVNNPVSGIAVAPTGGNGQYVAKGKSLQLKAVVETENGKVSNQGVTWELRDAKNVLVDEKATGMKISTNGKVTASKTAAKGSYNVRAVAKDGSGVTRTYAISVADPATSIMLYGQRGYMSSSVKYVLKKGSIGTLATISSNIQQGTIIVTSSNPSVLSASIASGGRLQVAAEKKGSATLTLKAMDGSGKQVKYSFVVR